MSYTRKNAGTYRPWGGKAYLATPKRWWNILNKEFGFTLDVAADDKNHMTQEYLTYEDNALKFDWLNYQVEPGAIWMAPPWDSSVVGYWSEKAALEASLGAIVVGLLPTRPEAMWWHRDVLKQADEVRFIDGTLAWKAMDDGMGSFTVPPACLVVWHFGMEHRHPHTVRASSYPSTAKRKR